MMRGPAESADRDMTLTKWYVATPLELKLGALVDFGLAHAARRVIVCVSVPGLGSIRGSATAMSEQLAGLGWSCMGGSLVRRGVTRTCATPHTNRSFLIADVGSLTLN